MDGARCPSCGQSNPSGFAFCGHCGSPLRETAYPPWFPTEERKLVTVLFVDVTDSTTLASRLGAEGMRSVIARFFAAMREEVHRTEGSVEKFVGDAVMAVFGLPYTHEDDAVRAVRTALAMRQRMESLNDDQFVAELGFRVGIGIGIDTGEVMAAAGPAEGRDFLITGDPVNAAARLEKAASDGQILVGERTHRAARDHFLFRAVGVLALKGKEEGVPAWDVLGPAVGPTGVRVAARLVGREHELAQLRRLYGEVAAHRAAHRAVIVGPAGIGKSRLFQEFASTLAGEQPPVLRTGRCSASGEAGPFQPLIEILREESGITPADSLSVAREKLLTTVDRLGIPEAADGLGHTAGLDLAGGVIRTLEPEAVREELVHAWRAFFLARASARPLVVRFEDLHWGTDALHDLLEAALAGITDVPLFTVALARPELLERRPAWRADGAQQTLIMLERLDPASCRALLTELAQPYAVPPALAETILAKAEGNPFFIEELVRMLLDRGQVMQRPDGWTIDDTRAVELPDSIQGVIAARIDSLPAVEKAVLHQAAVIGRTFWPGALSVLVGTDVAAALDDLTRREFVERRTPTPEGEVTYAFRHVLMHDVAYARLPRATRGAAHLRIAEWLEQQAGARLAEAVDLLAYHFQEAALQAGREEARIKAGAYLRRAAEHAHGRFALQEAAAYAEAALAFVPESERAGLLELLGDAHHLRGRLADASRVYRQALMSVGSPRAQARLHRKIAPTVTLEAAADELARARELLALEADPVEEAAVLTLLGRIAHHRMDYVEAMGHFRQGREMLQRYGNEAELARCLFYLGDTLVHLGRMTEAYAAAVDLQTLAAGLHNPYLSALNHRLHADIHTAQGRYPAAAQSVEAALGLGRATANVQVTAWALGTRGRLHRIAGDLGAAAADLEEALRLVTVTEQRAARVEIAALLSGVYADLGRRDESLRLLRQASETARAANAGELLVRTEVAGLYAGAPGGSGDPCESSALLLERWGASRPLLAASLGVLAGACLDAGGNDQAERAARQCLDVADAAGMPYERWMAVTALGRIAARRGEEEQAESLLREAAQRLGALGARLAQARALVHLGIVLLRRSAGEAADTFEEARRLFSACGAARDLADLRAIPEAAGGASR